MHNAETDGMPRRHLKLASAVMFVADLGRSVEFYRELLSLEVTSQNSDAALLVSTDGSQLYLRGMGRIPHPIGGIGINYLIWTAESEADLDRCERFLRSRSRQVTRETIDGFTLIEGRGPDGVPVMLTYPGPEQAPRHEIMLHIYDR